MNYINLIFSLYELYILNKCKFSFCGMNYGFILSIIMVINDIIF